MTIRTIRLPRQSIIIALEEVHGGYELSEKDLHYAQIELELAEQNSYDIRYIPNRSNGKYFISIQTGIDISFLVMKNA